MLLAGYFVDAVPFLRARFGLVLIIVFLASLGPAIIEWSWERVGRRALKWIMARLVHSRSDQGST